MFPLTLRLLTVNVINFDILMSRKRERFQFNLIENRMQFFRETLWGFSLRYILFIEIGESKVVKVRCQSEEENRTG